LSPPAGGVVPGSEAVFEACSAGSAVAWLVASSSACCTDHFGCSACFFLCHSLSLQRFFSADSRGTAARARLFGCSACEGACFLMSQPFVAAISLQLHVRSNVWRYYSHDASKVEYSGPRAVRRAPRRRRARTTRNYGALGLVPRPREDCTDESWG